MNDILLKLEELTINASQIDKDLFEKFNVKRGLRNQDGTGVLVGLTKIGDVVGYEKKEDKIIPCDGRLYYRGIK
jgi:citrate synthase